MCRPLLYGAGCSLRCINSTSRSATVRRVASSNSGSSVLSMPWRPHRRWRISCDGKPVAEDRYQALIIVNGYLGPNLPFAEGVPLGSGDFHLFTLRDLGTHRVFGQLKHAWDASVARDPEKWGFEGFRVTRELVLRPADDGVFPVNVDGSTMPCRGSARVAIVGQIPLLAGK